MTGLRQHTLLDGDDLFVEFKGALTVVSRVMRKFVCRLRLNEVSRQ